jgi:hypothetical protein
MDLLMFVSVQMVHLVYHAMELVGLVFKFKNLILSKIDSTRNLFQLPTIPSQTTTPIVSLMFGNHGKYGARGSNNVIPPVSTCSPSSRDACNGGQCMLLNGAAYTCRCREGYTGVYCENS